MATTLNVTLAFNQDTLNRHASEVEPGGGRPLQRR